MDKALWERPPTDGQVRRGNGAKCTKKPAGFNVLGASSKGTLVGMVSLTVLGQLVATVPSGEQERVALWDNAVAVLHPATWRRVFFFLSHFLQEKRSAGVRRPEARLTE